MRITRTMAANAATLMAGEKYDPIVKRAKDKLYSCVLDALKIIPNDILEVCKKYPDVFYCSNDVYMYWNGRDYRVTLPFPVPSQIRSLKNIHYPAAYQEKIVNACKEVFMAENKREDLQYKLESAIYNLRTKARLEADFPEACKFIELPMEKQVPVVPVPNELRKLFQK